MQVEQINGSYCKFEDLKPGDGFEYAYAIYFKIKCNGSCDCNCVCVQHPVLNIPFASKILNSTLVFRKPCNIKLN